MPAILPQLHLSPAPKPPTKLKIIEKPSLHSPNSNPNTNPNPGLLFREKILYLENDLRIDSSRALTVNPTLRSAPLSSVLSVVQFLSSYSISPHDSSRIFQMYPHLLTCDPHSELLPTFDFLLNSAGIPFHAIRKSIVRCPRLLVSSVPSRLRPALYFLRRLGFTGPHRITAHTTLLLVSHVEKTLIPKLDYLQSLGFSYRDTVKMVLRSPGLLTFSIENNFKPKVEFLLGEMGRDANELKEFPQYFSFSLEGKIRPRHQALVEGGVAMGLTEMLKVSDGEFTVRLLEMRLQAAEEEDKKKGNMDVNL